MTRERQQRVAPAPGDEPLDQPVPADPASGQPCPYLPGRAASLEVFLLPRLEPAQHLELLARGFRRSGLLLYRPRCPACAACIQVRVLTAEFRPTASMRRVWKRNRELRVEPGPLDPNDEKFELFCRYLDAQHDRQMARTREVFEDFLYSTCTDTHEIRYHLGERLVGVSIVDALPAALSSVYMFFDPAVGQRSLGTYSILWEIEHCRQAGWLHYYLGYYVADSRTMAYKARFRPQERLVDRRHWRRYAEG